MSRPAKGSADYYAEGDWNARCAECGAKAKASELVKNWKGQYIHPWHVDVQRHPQDFVRGIPDNQAAPWTQNYPDILLTVCSFSGRSGYADLAIADCALPDYAPPRIDFNAP